MEEKAKFMLIRVLITSTGFGLPARILMPSPLHCITTVNSADVRNGILTSTSQSVQHIISCDIPAASPFPTRIIPAQSLLNKKPVTQALNLS